MNYQGNTRKEREKAEKKQRPEKNIEKVVTGEVVQKSKGPGRKFKEIFLGGDAKQAARYVTIDVLFPAIRNMMFDIIRGYAERVIFPDTQRRRPMTNYRSHYQGGVQYNRSFDPRDPIDPRERSYSVQSRIRQNRHEIGDVIIASKQEAELVVERLTDILDKYEVVALADLYDLLGLETSHIDNIWGWTYLGKIRISHMRQGYLLELPPLEEI